MATAAAKLVYGVRFERAGHVLADSAWELEDYFEQKLREDLSTQDYEAMKADGRFASMIKRCMAGCDVAYTDGYSPDDSDVFLYITETAHDADVETARVFCIREWFLMTELSYLEWDRSLSRVAELAGFIGPHSADVAVLAGCWQLIAFLA